MTFGRVILFFCLLSSLSQAQTPNHANVARPYNFNAPDLHSLLPFSPEQLQIFRQQKVKTVFAEESNGVNGIFHFNELGQLVKERTWYWEKKKKVFIDSTIYRYNAKGQLTLSRSFDGSEAYDSLVYDNSGRLVYYLSQEFIKDKKNKTKLVLWDLHSLKNDGDNYILEDKADAAGKVWMVFDRNNRSFKSWSDNRRDSLAGGLYSHSPVMDGPVMTFENYYYREKEAAEYLLGKEKIFTNGFLTTEIQYDMNQKGLIYKRSDYVYGQNGKLLQVNDSYASNLKTIFIYDNKGLPTEEVSLHPDLVEITFFTYLFY